MAINRNLRELNLGGISLIFWGTMLTIIWGAIDVLLDIGLPFATGSIFDVIGYTVILIGLWSLKRYSKGFKTAAISAIFYIVLSILEYIINLSSQSNVGNSFNVMSFIISILQFAVSLFMVCTILLSIRKLCLRHDERQMADMCDGWAKVYFIFKVVGYIGVTMGVYIDSIIFLVIMIILMFTTFVVEVMYLSFIKKCKKLLNGREYYESIR